MKIYILIPVLLLLLNNFIYLTNTQSTCPVIIQPSSILQIDQQLQPQQQGCKCGIKTDGQIYIFCARKNLIKIPKFMRSSILYDELILSGNLIEKIVNNSFQGLRVKHLYLDDNKLISIEQGAFIELANYLEELVLDMNYDALNNNDDLLINNNIQLTPPISIFENLLNLKILKLNGFIHMFKLSSYLFNKTRKLEVLYLLNSNLIEISTNSFNGIELSLKELNLNHNLLNNNENLSENLFKLIYNNYFKRLEVLSLAYNHIKTLIDFNNDDYFSGGGENDGKLSVDLSFNEINYIDESLFNKLRFKLVKLNLNNNELTTDDDYEEQSILQQQQQLQQVKSLNFVKNLINLRELYLDYNHIKYLNKNLFKNLVKLEVLSLKGNYLYSFSSFEIFNGLDQNLRKLNLASNKINFINENTFQNLVKLKELNLEKNNLNNCLNTSQIFNGLENELKLLNLESNNLNNNNLISISNLINIEILKLGNNNLSRLNENLFKNFANLTYIDLEQNNFRRVPYITNKTLINLNLFKNKICYFDIYDLLSYYKNLKNFNLNSNQLECDCKLKNLRIWLEKSNVNLTASNSIELLLLQNLRCNGPSRHRGKLVTSLDVNDFVCDDQSNLNSNCMDESDILTTISIPTTTTTRTTTTTKITIQPIIVKTTTSSIISNKHFIKQFNIYFLSINNVLLKWQIEDDDIDGYEQKFKSRIRYFKLIVNELYIPITMNNDVNMTILSSNMKVIQSNIREYRLNNLLNENKIYELCLLLIYDAQDYEKNCQIINTKTSLPDLSMPQVTIPTINNFDSYKQTNNKNFMLNTAAANLNSQDNFLFKFETKQILLGSLIGALIVIILILIIIYLLKLNKTSINEKKMLFEQQTLKKQTQQQQHQLGNNNSLLMPIDYNTLRANILEYNNHTQLFGASDTNSQNQNQQILFIRPVATLPTYTTQKKSKLSLLLSRFKSNNKKEKKQLKSKIEIPINQQQINTAPFLLSDLNIFPSYIIKPTAIDTINRCIEQQQNSNNSSHDTTTSSSSTASTSSGFASFTPMLSTTLETLTNSSNNFTTDANNSSSNYQHMYHEITDTLLSSKSKYFLNSTNPTAAFITNVSPFLPIKLNNNASQYLISTNDGFYENHSKEMFI